jgi:hypothetical protein
MQQTECSQNRITVHQAGEMVPRALLVCGILSSLLYVAMNIVGALRFEGYDWLSQTVSELSAIDAPTRPLWVALAIPYTLLVVAFGWGVRKSSGQNRRLHVVGGLILAYGALGFLWPFAPMHLRGATFTATDAMHIVLGSATVVLMLLAVWCGAGALGRTFRVYSFVTLLIVLLFGALTGWEAPGIAANSPTPKLGLWERINIGAFLLWIVVLATTLLRALNPKTTFGPGADELPRQGSDVLMK